MVIMAAFVAVAVALFIGIMGVYAAYTTGLPDIEQLEDFTLDEGSRVVSADGVELATFAAEQREVVPYRRDPAAAGRRPGGRRGPDLLDQPVHRLARHRRAPPCRT